MRKGLTVKIMVELVVALLIFIILFSLTGTGKEKGWSTVDLMDEAMDKGWPWGCKNVGTRTFEEFMNYMSGVYDNCKTNDKCGTEGCLSMELDMGPTGIGDGTWYKVGFHELKHYGMDYYNSYILGVPIMTGTKVFCEQKNADGGDEIDAYYVGGDYARKTTPLGVTDIYTDAAQTMEHKICRRFDSAESGSGAFDSPFFAVSDGSKVRISARKNKGMLGENTDIKLVVDGGLFTVLEPAPCCT